MRSQALFFIEKLCRKVNLLAGAPIRLDWEVTLWIWKFSTDDVITLFKIMERLLLVAGTGEIVKRLAPVRMWIEGHFISADMVDLSPGKCCCIHAEAVPMSPAIRKKVANLWTFFTGVGSSYGGGDKYDPTKQHYRCQKQRTPELKCPGFCYDQGGRRTDVDHHSTTSISYTFNKLKLPSLSQMAHSRLLATLSNRSISCICKGQMEAVFPVHLVLFLPKPSPSTAGSTGCSGRLSGSSTGQTLSPKLWWWT